MSGIDIILSERKRQISIEGYSSHHDDAHVCSEMSFAAACYCLPDQFVQVNDKPAPSLMNRLRWPWKADFYKRTPHDRIRELAKAGALIAAEIDRLLRLRVDEIERRSW